MLIIINMILMMVAVLLLPSTHSEWVIGKIKKKMSTAITCLKKTERDTKDLMISSICQVRTRRHI